MDNNSLNNTGNTNKDSLANEISAGLDEISQLARALSTWDAEGGLIPMQSEA